MQAARSALMPLKQLQTSLAVKLCTSLVDNWAGKVRERCYVIACQLSA